MGLGVFQTKKKGQINQRHNKHVQVPVLALVLDSALVLMSQPAAAALVEVSVVAALDLVSAQVLVEVLVPESISVR